MADPDHFAINLPHRPSQEEYFQPSTVTGRRSPTEYYTHLHHDPDPQAPSALPSRSASVSAQSSNPSEFDGATSPWDASFGPSLPNTMAPIARRKNEPEIELPVTYTPTTHRISKAKKGKKVHACEYGCGKIFTRAEHRKRHEANHRNEPLYKCSVKGCEKPFQRVDLLNRHLERQHGIQASAASSSAHRLAAGNVGPNVGQAAVAQQLHRSPSPHPSRPNSFGGSYAVAAPPQMPSAQLAPGMGSNYGVPNINGPQVQFHSPETGYVASSSTQPYWGQLSSMTYDNPLESLPRAEAAGLDQLSYEPNYGLDTGADKAFPGPSVVGAGPAFDPLDARSGSLERTQSQPAVATELVNVDEETIRHYEQCFWACVDTSFQILHPASYVLSRDEFLHDIVCALGAQISPRSDAKLQSRGFASRARARHQQLDPETFARSATLPTLQAVFLYEYFEIYRSTGPGAFKSPQFTALYLELQRAYDAAQVNATAEKGYKRWVNLESRHRLLAACFLLDTHRQQLLEETASIQYPEGVMPSVPRPCPFHLWTAKDEGEWYAVKSHRQPSLGVVPLFVTQLEHATSLHVHGTISPSANADPVSATVQLTTLVPIKSLVITASCSWLFAQKVEERTWRNSIQEIRAWATEGGDAPIAAWLAGKMLRSHFFPNSAGSSPPSSLERDWCLYLCALVIWAYTLPVDGQPRQSRQSSISLEPGRSAAETSSGSTAYMELSSSHPANPVHPTSNVRGTLQPSPSTRTARGNLQPLAAGPAPPPPSLLQRFLNSLATHQWTDVQPLRGSGGAACVLEAVGKALGGISANGKSLGETHSPSPAPTSKAALKGKGKGKSKAKAEPDAKPSSPAPVGTTFASRNRLVEERGALVGEAVGVLSRLRAGRGIWF